MVFSLTHFLQHFLERIMSDALEEYDGEVSTGVLPFCGLPVTSMLLLWKSSKF